MPYRAIYRDPGNNAHHEFDVCLFNNAWYVKTKRGHEPLTPRLKSGLLFRAHEHIGDWIPGEPVPPNPVPDPVTMPADFNVHITEQRYGGWSIATAYWFAKNPAHDSAEIDAKCQSDPDFREALNASAGIEHLIPPAPLEMRTPPKAEQRYKTFSQLATSQTDYINRKTRVGGWALEKSFSLIVDRNGLWRDSGEFAAYGGYVVAECQKCRSQNKYPLSGWVDGACRCQCGAHEHYSQVGTKIEGES